MQDSVLLCRYGRQGQKWMSELKLLFQVSVRTKIKPTAI
jgi:hypothetical protein